MGDPEELAGNKGEDDPLESDQIKESKMKGLTASLDEGLRGIGALKIEQTLQGSYGPSL